MFSQCMPSPVLCRVVQGVGPDIEVIIPADQRQRFVVDAVAFYVMRDGTEFEQVGGSEGAEFGLPCQCGAFEGRVSAVEQI